jgi:putative membrane protein
MDPDGVVDDQLRLHDGEVFPGGPTRGIFGRTWSPEVVGLAMMSIGTGALILAVIEHWTTMRAFRAEGFEKKWSLALVVAALIATLGFFALVTILVGD